MTRLASFGGRAPSCHCQPPSTSLSLHLEPCIYPCGGCEVDGSLMLLTLRVGAVGPTSHIANKSHVDFEKSTSACDLTTQ